MSCDAILVLTFVLACLYLLVAPFICIELQDDRRRWWCPICALFGKESKRFP